MEERTLLEEMHNEIMQRLLVESEELNCSLENAFEEHDQN